MIIEKNTMNKVMSINITLDCCNLLDTIVKNDSMYTSRSELIRQAVFKWLDWYFKEYVKNKTEYIKEAEKLVKPINLHIISIDEYNNRNGKLK